MHPYYPYMNYGYPVYQVNPSYPQQQPYQMYRQQAIRGQATWTEGGDVTKCEIPWSENEYMTAAVGGDSPYHCGELLKIRNVSAPYGREIIVMVVDEVEGYPSNRINLHRRAFEALGVNPNIGVLNIDIIPTPKLEQEKWGKYLLEVTQVAYPSYNITNYRTVRKTRVSDSQTKETYEFTLQSPQEIITVQGNVIYNPNTDRIVSFDIKEM